MGIKKLLIDFRPNTNAFERNRLVRIEMSRIQFNEIIRGVLIGHDDVVYGNCYEDHELELAKRIEIHYM